MCSELRDAPADDPAREHVDDEGDVDEARARSRRRSGRRPRAGSAASPRTGASRDRRARGEVRPGSSSLERRPRTAPAQAQPPHQPLHRAARHADAFPLAAAARPFARRRRGSSPPRPAGSDVHSSASRRARAGKRVRIAPRAPCARSTSTGRSAARAQIGSTPYSPRCASMNATITSRRRSSSAWAKYADALRRISLARRSSRFSRSSCLQPLTLGPSSGPAAARVTLGLPHPVAQRLRRAADLRGDRLRSPPTASRARAAARSTIRTARSRTSGENRAVVVPMTPSSQGMEPPGNPGRFSIGRMRP